jgi:hypothetical protein
MDELSREDRIFAEKRKVILFEQKVAFFFRLLGGLILIVIGYLAIEKYRQDAAYKVKYSEQRLQSIASLWAATDRHCTAVLKVVGDKNEPDVIIAQLKRLGEAYYDAIRLAGVFLGSKTIKYLRSSVGDIWLEQNKYVLSGDMPTKKLEALRCFRSHWLDTLKRLEVLGARSESSR